LAFRIITVHLHGMGISISDVLDMIWLMKLVGKLSGHVNLRLIEGLALKAYMGTGDIDTSHLAVLAGRHRCI
jgi:hypothetical protein